jgi:hypothetical protein
MVTITVNGVPCDPNLCSITTAGYQLTLTAPIGGQVIDINWALQSAVPIKPGGDVTVVLAVDADASSVSTAISGNNLGDASYAGSAQIVGGQIVETLQLHVGANSRTGGDFQGEWIATVPPQPPQPPCTTCTPPPPPDVPMVQPIPVGGGLWLVLLVVVMVAAVAKWGRA